MTQRKIQSEQLDLGAIGDVSGPASSFDDQIPLFSGTSGKTLKTSKMDYFGNATYSTLSVYSQNDSYSAYIGAHNTNGAYIGGYYDMWVGADAGILTLESVDDDVAIVADNDVTITGTSLSFNSVPVVTTTGTQTLTNKRITSRVYSTTSVSAISPASDSYDATHITALSVGLAIANPTGTPTDGQRHVIRIKDNGTARAISWTSGYRAVGVALPTSTTASKTLYVGAIYNSADSKWDVVMVNQEV